MGFVIPGLRDFNDHVGASVPGAGQSGRSVRGEVRADPVVVGER